MKESFLLSKITVMSFRFMRVFVFFDLPVLTAKDRKEYRRFRTYLIKSGFIMQQESVYSKLALNGNAAQAVASNVKKHAPSNGLVSMLIVTEKQYANITYITGEEDSEYLASVDRMVIL